MQHISYSIGLFAAAALASCTSTFIESYPCPEGMDCSGNPATVVEPPGEGETGSACERNRDCEGIFCVTVELLNAFGAVTDGIDVPNGMCAQFPCTDDASCGTSGVCTSLIQFTGSEDKLCLRPCSHLGFCRWEEGYACMFPFDDDPEFGVCLPSSVIAGVYCPGGECSGP